MPPLDTRRMMYQPDLLTVREVADYLRVSRVTVWRWCQQGVVPAVRIGRTWRIRRDALMDGLDLLGGEAQLPAPIVQLVQQ